MKKGKRMEPDDKIKQQAELDARRDTDKSIEQYYEREQARAIQPPPRREQHPARSRVLRALLQ